MTTQFDPRDLLAYARLVRDTLRVWRATPPTADALRAAPCAAFIRRFLAHFCRHPFSRMHYESFARYDALSAHPLPGREGRRLALAAPRGSAKSTIHSLALPLLDILLQRERYILIISATTAQATARLRGIRSELSRNALLRLCFPDETTARELWSRRAVCVNGVQVEGHGAGVELRGLAHGEYRPTKIILDDAEASARALSARGRRMVEEWYYEVVEHLGDAYTHIEVVGTVLHADSLLSRLLKRADFEARLHRSIAAWSPARDEWEEWRAILLNPENPDRIASARQFHLARAARMDAGTRVLWRAREGYEALMEQLALQGQAAFFKEKQNAPFAAEGRVFDIRRWSYFTLRGGTITWDETGEERNAHSPQDETDPGHPPAGNEVQLTMDLDGDAAPGAGPDARAGAGPRTTTRAAARRKPPPRVPLEVRSLTIYGFLDTALGRSTHRGDFAAIATVGVGRNGDFYALDIWLERAEPDRQIRAVFDLHQHWGYRAFGFEGNFFQTLLGRDFHLEQQARRAAGEKWRMGVIEVVHHRSKQDRIDELQVAAAGGWLAFARSLPDEFFAQAGQYPTGTHDDGLDALAAAVKLADGSGKPAAIVTIGGKRGAAMP